MASVSHLLCKTIPHLRNLKESKITVITHLNFPGIKGEGGSMAAKRPFITQMKYALIVYNSLVYACIALKTIQIQ